MKTIIDAKRANLAVLSAVVLSALAAGCRGQTAQDEAPVFGIRNMYDQPRYNVQSESKFFADGRTMRPLVEGVVATNQEVEPPVAQGRLPDQTGYVLEIPKEVIERHGGLATLQDRGRERFNIYCALCHGETGNGQGLVAVHAQKTGAAAFAPTSFHQDRLRHAPDGQIFATITNGKSNMPPYAMQIPVDDRWAIVSYVRVLQLAQPKLAEDKAADPSKEAPSEGKPL